MVPTPEKLREELPEELPEERSEGLPEGLPEENRPTEEQVNMKDTVPQRSDSKGTKIEDMAGTGEQDSQGG